MEADTRRMPPRRASTRPYVMTDHWGIVKADIGLKGSRTVAIGKAGNPDVMPGVDIASARAPKSSPPRE